MTNRRIIALKEDSATKKSLEMAFGNSSELRKKWLSGY
jgi:hypothetical protein